MAYVAASFRNAIHLAEAEYEQACKDYDALYKEHCIVVKALEDITRAGFGYDREDLVQIAADAIKAAGI